MSTFFGILSGRHDMDAVLGTLRDMGNHVVRMPERG